MCLQNEVKPKDRGPFLAWKIFQRHGNALMTPYTNTILELEEWYRERPAGSDTGFHFYYERHKVCFGRMYPIIVDEVRKEGASDFCILSNGYFRAGRCKKIIAFKTEEEAKKFLRKFKHDKKAS